MQYQLAPDFAKNVTFGWPILRPALLILVLQLSIQSNQEKILVFQINFLSKIYTN